MKLKSIAPVHIQKWQNELLEQYENTYVRNIYGLFQMSLDRAVVLGMISSNPAKIVGNVKKVRKKLIFGQKKNLKKLLRLLCRRLLPKFFFYLYLVIIYDRHENR